MTRTRKTLETWQKLLKLRTTHALSRDKITFKQTSILFLSILPNILNLIHSLCNFNLCELLSIFKILTFYFIINVSPSKTRLAVESSSLSALSSREPFFSILVHQITFVQLLPYLFQLTPSKLKSGVPI